jgi:CheY-like chemotaxis protein
MRSAASSRAQHSGNILLVDDNRDGVMARRSLLEELGYNVVSADTGSDALQAVERQNFDLIITDYKMSPMNGLQLIETLRNANFKNPIILLTGFAETLGFRTGTTGADVVIQKSANEVATLLRHTNRLLQPPPKKPARSTGRTAPKARSHHSGS